MLKPNNSNIFTGYIKQLLSSFNLPNCPIYKYTDDSKAVEGQTYLKDGSFQIYTKNGWINSGESYMLNLEVENRTKKFIIKNNIYDTYTHEYLGDYLRFQRDFLGIDLMPLYNCFFPTICTNVEFKNSKLVRTLKGTDDYILYMIPVKANKVYTIAMDSEQDIELISGYYNRYLDDDLDTNIANIIKKTYMHVYSTSFSAPFIYNKLKDEKIKDKDLKLFLKIKKINSTSIVILEGDYIDYYKGNKTIINFEVNDRPDKLITPLQLLSTNTSDSYVFSDRLIEYLTGNAITSEDEIVDNIKRVQSTMLRKANLDKPYELYGSWDEDMKYKLYSYAVEKNIIKEDTLGYVDKNIEQRYLNPKTKTTISNADIYVNNLGGKQYGK